LKGLPPTPTAPAPWLGLRERLLARADEIDAQGGPTAALRAEIEAWWEEQQRFDHSLQQWLGVHHEINNALVGVRGNAQLVLIGPVGRTPGIQERLETVIRESDRIQQAASRLRELKTIVWGGTPRAA
jgi:signal transduction histidine kinase